MFRSTSGKCLGVGKTLQWGLNRARVLSRRLRNGLKRIPHRRKHGISRGARNMKDDLHHFVASPNSVSALASILNGGYLTPEYSPNASEMVAKEFCKVNILENPKFSPKQVGRSLSFRSDHRNYFGSGKDSKRGLYDTRVLRNRFRGSEE
jgi:hypothetical protein